MLLTARHVRRFDVALVVWVALWVTLATLAFRDIRQLRSAGEATIAVGAGLRATADTLARLSDLPFIGEVFSGDLEQRVRSTARTATRAGREAVDDSQTYAAAVALVLALAPTVPLLAVYLPARRAYTRDRRDVRAALAAGDAGLEPYLAARARVRLPYSQIRRATSERALADEELARLGLARRASAR